MSQNKFQRGAYWLVQWEQSSLLELDHADIDLACLMLGFVRPQLQFVSPASLFLFFGASLAEMYTDKTCMVHHLLFALPWCRLDKRASVSDLRLECHDLERFSVINRFAKFHGRGQGDGAESSSSSDASGNAQKCLQRYVTALPMPRNLPDRIQCLSLW